MLAVASRAVEGDVSRGFEGGRDAFALNFSRLAINVNAQTSKTSFCRMNDATQLGGLILRHGPHQHGRAA